MARPGEGVLARVSGHRLALGNRALMQAVGVDVAPLHAIAGTGESRGHTVMWLAELTPAPRLLGIIAVADTAKPGAAAAVRGLQAAGFEVRLLSGDNRATAEAMGHALGIDRVIAEVLPGAKADAVWRLQREGRHVAMVGDGVNDGPALAAAQLGIAMGQGADVAMATAGITLMRGDPRLVAAAIAIGRATRRKIVQNLFWAFVYNVVGLGLAAAGLLTPMFAAAAMALSSVSVLGNALLLTRWRPAGEQP
jgi:Cu+-exporting ATPase